MSIQNNLIKIVYLVAISSILTFFGVQLMSNLNSSNNSQIQYKPDLANKSKNIVSSSATSRTSESTKLLSSSRPVSKSNFADGVYKGWMGSIDLEMNLSLSTNGIVSGSYTNPIEQQKIKVTGEFINGDLVIRDTTKIASKNILKFTKLVDSEGVINVVSKDFFEKPIIGSLLGVYTSGSEDYDVIISNNPTNYDKIMTETKAKYKVLGQSGKTYFLQNITNEEDYFTNEDWKLTKFKVGAIVEISSKIREYQSSKSLIDKQLPGRPSLFTTYNGLFQITKAEAEVVIKK